MTDTDTITTKSKMLVCIDENEHSRTALKFACKKGAATGCLVEMLYVIDTIDYHNLFSVAEKMKEERKQEVTALLEKLSVDAQKWGVTPSFSVREGLIADEILSCVEEDADINMLVLGAAPDGSSGKKGLLPSLATQIGDRLHIPLLIVPGNLTDHQIEALNQICT